MAKIRDIKPVTPVVAGMKPADFDSKTPLFPIAAVSDVTGLSPYFVKKVTKADRLISPRQLRDLLDQDAFSETFVPRSKILSFLSSSSRASAPLLDLDEALHKGDAHALIDRLPGASVNCVVTSTPYWAMRIYDVAHLTHWADGEICTFGMEQTPEGFIRHSIELLVKLKRVMTVDGSIWWNLMDTFNTRTQIRGNAVEALRAMQGKDSKGWHDHDCRRYSAGHSYLKDGEQCLIPFRIAERASRIGYFAKTVISWAKTSSMPEPQNSRVSRNVEYILHLTLQRTPKFFKDAYRTFPPRLGGRNSATEPDRLSDSWFLPTSAGRDGHGAQFPLALPARCIGLSTKEDDLVLDPFAGAGTAAVAARLLRRRFLGFDVSDTYIRTAKRRLAEMTGEGLELSSSRVAEPSQVPLLQLQDR